MISTRFSIAAVERDTGLSKDVLRMWERRYGFPLPARDANGERAYPADQVERLRQIKRLMDQGHRPGKLLALPVEALATLAPRQTRSARSEHVAGDLHGLEDLLLLIKQHDTNAYMQALQQRLARHGMQRFVQDIVAPLTQYVGEAWEDGRIEVFEEHLFTELTKRVLRQAMTALPAGLFRSLAGFAPMVFGLGQFPGRFFGLPAQFPALSGQGFQTLLATAAGLLQFLQQRPPADEGTFLIAGAAAGQGAAGVELRPVEADDAQAMAVFPGHSRARIHGIGQEGPP